MIININPERINLGTGVRNRPADRRAPQGQGDIPTPKRAHVNIIPAPESLSTLIRSAVAALRQGLRWDRGTILNLLV